MKVRVFLIALVIAGRAVAESPATPATGDPPTTVWRYSAGADVSLLYGTPFWGFVLGADYGDHRDASGTLRSLELRYVRSSFDASIIAPRGDVSYLIRGGRFAIRIGLAGGPLIFTRSFTRSAVGDALPFSLDVSIGPRVGFEVDLWRGASATLSLAARLGGEWALFTFLLHDHSAAFLVEGALLCGLRF